VVSLAAASSPASQLGSAQKAPLRQAAMTAKPAPSPAWPQPSAHACILRVTGSTLLAGVQSGRPGTAQSARESGTAAQCLPAVAWPDPTCPRGPCDQTLWPIAKCTAPVSLGRTPGSRLPPEFYVRPRRVRCGSCAERPGGPGRVGARVLHGRPGLRDAASSCCAGAPTCRVRRTIFGHQDVVASGPDHATSTVVRGGVSAVQRVH